MTFIVMARPTHVIPRLVRGTYASTVPREVPRTSRGMTWEEKRLPSASPNLTPMRPSQAMTMEWPIR